MKYRFFLPVLLLSSLVACKSNDPSLDETSFLNPPRDCYPEVWVECMRGNLSEDGIKADFEAINQAGFKGLTMFFGNRGGVWPGMEDRQIECLSPDWDAFVLRSAEIADSLGLFFTLQNCPGWAMAGGPWIDLDHCMRTLVCTRTDIASGERVTLPNVTVNESKPFLRPEEVDYRDIAVIAFPTPESDSGKPENVIAFSSDVKDFNWDKCLHTEPCHPECSLPPADSCHTLQVTLDRKTVVRSFETSCIQFCSHKHCYAPGISFRLDALYPDGHSITIAEFDAPQSNWMDFCPLTVSCDEAPATDRFLLRIANKYDMRLGSLRFFSSAKKNNWESEAGFCLRSILRESSSPLQDASNFVRKEDIIDLSAYMDSCGHLDWAAPAGKWTVLRIGHINSGAKNAPAVPEATGWECDKFSPEAALIHFDGYMGRMADLLGDKLGGMLMDSWECYTQTWTAKMPEEFERVCGYDLKLWMPALFGFVINDQQTTGAFLTDWRKTVNDLTVRFYKTMTDVAHSRGLRVSYETACGDVCIGDIMEYFKFADLPMCEFWRMPEDEYGVSALNFKPIRPTASAARLYGRKRVDAEAYTGDLNWSDTLQGLRETSNKNFLQGVTHLVHQAYTHNPLPDVLVPGSSFGTVIGTPFLRAQTWWPYMREFNRYEGRCTYMLEAGMPVSDVLWYLGDDFDHKPDQLAPFPEGYDYDYLNNDVLHHRISVQNGLPVTPEGISYSMIWVPENVFLNDASISRLAELEADGATVVRGPVDDLARTLASEGILPDVVTENAGWLHRRCGDDDFYFVCAPVGDGLQESVAFHNTGVVHIWDPVSGSVGPAQAVTEGDYTRVELDMPLGGSCFVVFDHKAKPDRIGRHVVSGQITLEGPWMLTFPEGWGAPESLLLDRLKSWTELDIPVEGRAFSGTAEYGTVFDLDESCSGDKFILDLGSVKDYVMVTVNGREFRPLWMPPFCIDVTDAILPGRNEILLKVTNAWHNRLAYDYFLPESKRKTWTDDYADASPTGVRSIVGGSSRNVFGSNPPCFDLSSLNPSGLLGPVNLFVLKHE